MWEEVLYVGLRAFAVIVYFIIGIVHYHSSEDWTVGDSLYFVVSSVATVGYGDYTPSTDKNRVFTSFYILFGIVWVLSSVDEVVKYFIIPWQNRILECFQPYGASATWMATRNIITSSIALLILSGIGTIVIASNENWTISKSFYWTMSTMTTVGYGDLQFDEPSSRLFAISFICVCVFTYSTMARNVKHYYYISDLNQLDKESDSGNESGVEMGETSHWNGESSGKGKAMDTTSSLDTKAPHGISKGGRERGHGSAGARFSRLPAEDDDDPKMAGNGDLESGLAGATADQSLSQRVRLASGSCSPARVGRKSVQPTPPPSRLHKVEEAADVDSSPEKGGKTGMDDCPAVDATVRLLLALEQINLNGVFTQEVARLRKKYEIMVPSDQRIQMTEMELTQLIYSIKSE